MLRAPAGHDVDGSTDDLLLKDRSSTSTRLTPDWQTFRRAIPWIAHGVLIFVSVSLFLLSVRLNDTRCAKKTTAPAIDAVEYHNVRFNGTLTWPSEFRGTPSPELDAAWKRIAANSEAFPRVSVPSALSARSEAVQDHRGHLAQDRQGRAAFARQIPRRRRRGLHGDARGDPSAALSRISPAWFTSITRRTTCRSWPAPRLIGPT